MKTIFHRIAALLLTCLGGCWLVPGTHAAGQARADYRNLSSADPAIQQTNPGVTCFQGYLNPGNPAAPPPQGGAVVLQECAFAQPFSQWYPSDTYGRDVVASVNEALYPDTSGATTRQGIEAGGKPFRYKWLLYQSTGTDVTAFDVTTVSNWFTQADRDAIAVQILALKAAVAASPLDTALRNLLLDVYYDLVVAEMQAVKPKLAALAGFHLGLQVLPPGKFIIDEEIRTYEEIVTAMEAAIAQFGALLTEPFPNIDPSSFDARESFGTPMGRYIFQREQVRRDSTPTSYANDNGIHEVPQAGPGGQPVTPGTLFTGYKDLNALLQIIGQRKRHQASLARLYGIRKAPGDVAWARACLELATGADDTDLQVIKSWFPEMFPPDLNALTPAEHDKVTALQTESGVLASLNAIEVARSELMGMGGFLNGSANVLGFDPHFLLLVQDQSGQIPPRESFDTLRGMLSGLNQPLTVALAKLATATSTYQSFEEKVDRVAADIDDADDALADRFHAITGFEPDADPGFNLNAPNPNPGSELDGVLRTIEALDAQAQERKLLTVEIDGQLRADVAGTVAAAVGDAETKASALWAAGTTYKNNTKQAYREMIAMSATAAGAQAAYDTWVDAANTPTATILLTGGTVAGITAVAGVANTVIQTAAATVIGIREKQIDYAGIDFTVTTETVDAALTVNQARQNLSTLKREQITHNLDIISDTNSLAQAQAERDGLLGELARIVTRRDGNVTAIRKKSYADPLHYHRAEAALVMADESFATAQRWMFYTLQALNYKWHGRFSTVEGARTYDSNTVFKCRNAGELDDLLTRMVLWDQVRVTQTTNSPLITTRISLLEHVLARNPQRHDPVNPSDPGTRADDTLDPKPPLLPSIPTLQYFRKVLAANYRDASKNLVIPFSTAFGNEIVDRVDGNFFRGASYDGDGAITDPGFWREKIAYVKVNIIADNALETPSNLSGALTYAGTTYFHTRVPPRGDRSVAGLAADDAPGELLVAPFRYWVSPDFSQNFVAQSAHKVSIPLAYNRSSGVVQGPGGIEDNLGTTFQVDAFAGRSIATSGWELRIPRRQGGGFIVDPDHINDIELIIAYKHSDRIMPPPN